MMSTASGESELQMLPAGPRTLPVTTGSVVTSNDGPAGAGRSVPLQAASSAATTAIANQRWSAIRALLRWDVATCYPDGPREGKADRAKRHNADFLLQPFIQPLQHPPQVGFAFQHGQHGIVAELLHPLQRIGDRELAVMEL